MSTLRPHKELILDVIFALNAEFITKPIPYDELALSSPRVNTDPDLVGDTIVTITSLNEKRYLGDVETTFDRLDLQAVFATIGLDSLELSSQADSVHGLIPELQETYNFSVYANDLIDDPVEFVDGKAHVVLTAASTSLFFKGEILVEVTAPAAVPLSSVIRNTTLSGLNYPV